MALCQALGLILLSLELAVDKVASLSFDPTTIRRRQLFTRSATAGRTLVIGTIFEGILPQVEPSQAYDELPSFVRPLTKLAPLGPAETNPIEQKSLNLPLDEIAVRLSKDLTVGASEQGGYFLTGDLSTDLFRNDCIFIDPTNEVSSLSQYQNALRILFDPAHSTVKIVTPLVVDEEQRQIRGRLRSRGVLQLPWHPRVSSYETDIVYSIDDSGLIYKQSQTWSKSASEALRESFTPTLFPPVESSLLPSTDEPIEVTKLFEYINGRRADEYSQEERFEIASLIDIIADKKYPWKRELLPGKWLLVYLQPGPDGTGIDRRIPFPDFPFNSNYQVFGEASVTNIGELFGPLLSVKVAGTLKDDETSLQVPKRFVANINSGKLCLGGNAGDACLPLPISGEGLFDGVYLGERIRIGQNLNGGGARVVQIRVT